jgi:hypothetical protein
MAAESAMRQTKDIGLSGVVAKSTQAAVTEVNNQLMSRRGKEALQAIADKDFGGDFEAAKADAVKKVTEGTPIEDIFNVYKDTVTDVGGGGGSGGAKPRVIKLK